MITIKHKHGGGRKHTVQVTVSEDATPGTWGSHQLLLEEYKRLDEEWVFGSDGSPTGAYKQMVFNTHFLEYILEKYGELHCEYCGRPDLKIIPWRRAGNQRHMATADHFYARSVYPELALSRDNLRVACPKCNEKKGTKTIDPSELKFPYPETRRIKL